MQQGFDEIYGESKRANYIEAYFIGGQMMRDLGFFFLVSLIPLLWHWRKISPSHIIIWLFRFSCVLTLLLCISILVTYIILFSYQDDWTSDHQVLGELSF